MVWLDSGKRTGFTATDHSNVGRFNRGFFAVLFDTDLAGTFIASPTLHKFHFVFLKQKLDSLGVLLDDFVFAGHHVGPIYFQSDHFKSQLRAILEMVVNIGMVQQDFGGNTSDVQAGATQKRVFLDDYSLQPEFASANRGHIAAGPATDNRYVVLCHTPSLSTFRLAGARMGRRISAMPSASQNAAAQQLLRRIVSSRRPGTKRLTDGINGQPDKPEILAAAAACRNLVLYRRQNPAVSAISQVPRYWRRVPPEMNPAV